MKTLDKVLNNISSDVYDIAENHVKELVDEIYYEVSDIRENLKNELAKSENEDDLVSAIENAIDALYELEQKLR
jgi:DNA repair ATPase RecN